MLLPGRHSRPKTTAGSPKRFFDKQLKIKKNLLPQRQSWAKRVHAMVAAS
jgi:hypothetical protein